AFGFSKEHSPASALGLSGPAVFTDLVYMLQAPHWGTLFIACCCLAVLLIWERPFIRRNRFLALVPGPLLAVMLGMALAALGGIIPGLGLAHFQFVKLPNLTGTSMSMLLSGPDWVGITSMQVWTTALTLALVASLETLLSVEAADKLDPQRRATPKN